MRFERIVSLGALCQVTHQINRCFPGQPKSLFDWLVTPFSAVRSIFETQGKHLCSDVAVDKFEIICQNYGVSYHHEFPRDANVIPYITQEALETGKSKLAHKFNKMVSMLSEPTPTLFVRFLGHHGEARAWPYMNDPEVMKISEINDLCTYLASRFPALPFEMAFVYLPQFTQLEADAAADPRVHLIPLDRTANTWAGNDSDWDEIFARFDLAIPPVLAQVAEAA
ncbi:hypothetical protein ACXR8U_14205 [Methylobacterium radiotolerans]|jgi:hypothetical protein|uniref:hypothetical protein n=1 Tax=Methylobacterium TaxID=407 RepID=UPI0005DD22E5|nr:MULTISPECIES: hypothetical protein [Methylobacterium]MBN6822132.1 hypothetical protein [Methylobacterium organophilum]GAN51992.1 hypothetical protein ME121_6095 [Methylobacterium sp. ME121]